MKTHELSQWSRPNAAGTGTAGEPSSRAVPILSATLLLLALEASATGQGSTSLVSRASTGEQANEFVFEPSISADGRYVSFHGFADNLVPGDTNDAYDVFVHDRVTGETTRASVNSAGNQGNSHSEFSAISADGRCVAFESDSTDLAPGSVVLNGIYVHDRAAGQTSCVSLDPAGNHANSECRAATISGDGRFVGFASWASNLVQGDLNDQFDIFVHDRVSGTTTRASVDSAGNEGNGPSDRPTLSTDGRFVVFSSGATNLVPGDGNGLTDIFVRDLVAGQTTRVSVDSAGNEGNGASGSSPGPTVTSSLSADGRYVAFNSEADNLVPGDTNGVDDVFVHDRTTGQTVRISVSSAGLQANGPSIDPRLTADGRFVAFSSDASDLVTGDVNGATDLFLHDRATGATTLASLSTSGAQGNGDSWEPAVSGDGRWVTFHSYATDFSLADANGALDVFVRDLLGCSPTIATYCVAGTTGHGCAPSISGTGTPSASAGSGFLIEVSAVEGQRDGIVFYGLSGPQQLPFGGGSSFLCVAQPLQRTGLLASGGTAGGCDGHLTVDWNQFLVTHPGPLGAPFVGGETVWAQAWFRDAATPGGSNLSNGLWFNVCP